MTLALLGLFTELNDRFSYPYLYTSSTEIPTLYGHLDITDSFSCPWGTKVLTFSVNSTRLTRTDPLMFL